MTDLAKRNTLKILAATAAATATGGPALAAAATGERPRREPGLARIDVTTRLSVSRNDLELVLTNSGGEPVAITAMTPRKVVVPRGEFDLAGTLRDGPLRLPAGASVAVPIRPHRGAVTLPALGHSLSDTLRKSVSIVTDHNAFASVTVRQMTALA